MQYAHVTLEQRCSRVNPKLSAWAYLYGNYDFNKNPLALIGTRVLIHLKADVRASWQNHGEDGWYIGPSMEHYRCVKCYVPTTWRERDADTVSFFPKKIKFPKTTTEDYLRQAASDIVFILQNKPSIVHSLDFGNETENHYYTFPQHYLDAPQSHQVHQEYFQP